MTKAEAKHVAAYLRQMAPAAPALEGGSSHDGRRAFLRAADRLDPHNEVVMHVNVHDSVGPAMRRLRESFGGTL